MVRLLAQVQAGLRDAQAAHFVEGVNGGNQTVPVIEFPNGKTATNPSLAQVQAGLAA